MSEADPTGSLPTMPNAGGGRATDAAAGDAATGSGYRVLARKYRPATFDDLIGQEAMVRTLSNAFEAGRIPQAWILTGVRGVGKTTTARILARGLNYELPDGSIRAPTIHMPALGVHCAAIMASRHVDVLEMDAASHNGVDDIRQINDAVRYAPVSARYKVYILDEVHMLTSQAFNALLKTLEEPPPHAKFIFATTEIREVPITVLSRCQRFDLRRVEADRLVLHLRAILDQEGVAADGEALALLARAAEGSVRDSLSLLDQAISHAAGAIRGEDVRQMLGLVDRTRVIDLFGALMRGDIAGALAELRAQYASGADPMVVLTDLAEFTHFVTRVKVVPSVAADPALAETERQRGREFAAGLSIALLSRTWQMLLKGIAEVRDAARPLAAAEMALVRIAYAATLPSPEEAIRALNDAPRPAASAPPGGGPSPAPEGARGAAPVPPAGLPQAFSRGPAGAVAGSVAPPGALPGPGGGAAQRAAAGGSQSSEPQSHQPNGPVARGAAPAAGTAPPAELPAFAGFTDLIAFIGSRRDLTLKAALERDVRLVRFEDGRLEIALEPSASKALIGELPQRLSKLTGRRWMVAVSAAAGAPTVQSQRDARRDECSRGAKADPVVQSVLKTFPGAEVVAVRLPEDTAGPAATPQAAGAPAADEPPAALAIDMTLDDLEPWYGPSGREDEQDALTHFDGDADDGDDD